MTAVAKSTPVLGDDYSAHRGSEGGLSEKFSDLYAKHPKRVWGAGICCCVCLLIIIIVGSLVGTVAQTTNAKLLQFVATFDELCAVQNDAIPSSFHIELDNPSSIGVSVNPFTLQIRALADNMDTSDGTLAMELTLPAIEVPGGEGAIDFATDVKLVDVPLCQRIASDFMSQKPVVILLKAAVPVNALGLGTTVDVAFPFYLNSTMRDPNAEPPTSLEFAKFVSDDLEKLVLDLGLRVNGSERFVANVPPMSIGARYTDREQAQGPYEAVVAQVNTQPFTFKEGWNYFNFTTTVMAANATYAGAAFKDLLTRQPVNLRVSGQGGDQSCWMQRFLGGMQIDLSLKPRPAGTKATFERVDVNINSVDSAKIDAGIVLNIAEDLRVVGQIPPLTVGVNNQRGEVMISAQVTGLSVQKGANPFAVQLQIVDVAKLTKVVSDIANKVPTQMSINAVGANVMSRVAARYQIVTPFHGFVDPFALSTPAPTPPPPPAQKALLTGGGLHKLEVTSNDATAMVIAIEFALPPIASVNWDVPAYTIELSVPGQAVHAQIVVDAVVKPAAGGAPSVVALTATITVRDYSAAARTINAILAQEMYTLSVRGTGAPNDVIGQFLSKLEPIVVSRPPATQDPSATMFGGGVDTMMSAMAASGFKITGASSSGLDVTGRWAVVEALFAVGINATIDVNLTPPPQISILHVRPATRGGGEAKLLDIELRSVTGTLDAYKAAVAVTANNRSSTDLAINMLLKRQTVELALAGTSTGTSLFARLLANVRHRVVIQPPAPAMVAGMMTQAQAVLLGMRYKTSGPDSVTIAINFNATLPIQAVVDVGNLRVDVVHQNVPILTVEAAQFKLVPDVNQFALEATINGFNRAALEDAVGRAVFLPPSDQPPQQFLFRGSIGKAEWGASRAIPLELLFDMPPGPNPAEMGKDPNQPIKCTELESLRICPAPGSMDTECLNLEQLREGGVSPSALGGLLDSCSLAIDLGLYLGNPTTLDIRVDTAKLKITFDDNEGVPFPFSYDPKKQNLLGLIDSDYKGAAIQGQDVIRFPINVLAVKGTDTESHEMCVRAGWNMVTKGKLFVDLVDGEINVRLDKFPLKVKVEKKGIPVENIPKNLRVKCVDYLANLNIAVDMIGPGDRT
jgi:hypothetical protein